MNVGVGGLIGGRYRLTQHLGDGGMASVYRATHVVTEREVAVKVLRLPEGAEQRLLATQLFEREFVTLGQVSHPRVVAAYDYGIDALAGPFYAMELLDGGDLHERTPVPWRQACGFARDVCAALSLLHARRFVYRDLSPRNVRCTTSGVAKLIDFGGMAPFGVPTETVGTPPFVAPEVMQQQRMDARTDLYALGATLYYALTGQHAYPARSLADIWEIWRTLPLPPSATGVELPESLDRLIMQLLQHDPQQRPADAVEVIQRLEAIAGLPPDVALHVGDAYLVAPSLVAREPALRKLREARSAARRGKATAVMLSGPHGIGRSRLLQENQLRAKVQGFAAVTVRARDDSDGEYGLLRSLIEALLEAAPAEAERAPTDARLTLAEVAPRLRSDDVESTELVGAAAERHARIRRAACTWLAAIARQRPLCLGIDDSVRADVPSLVALATLLREHADAPIALVWCAASEERGGADWPMALVLLQRASSIITLSELTLDETSELLRAVFGDVPNLSQLASYVQHTAAGNPRDVLQLLQHLVSTGVLVHTAGAWSLPERMLAANLPSNMLQALEQRVSRLGGDARLLALAIAAEPRQKFSAEECQLLLGDHAEERAAVAVRENVEAGVLEQANGGYRLAQLGFSVALSRLSTTEEREAQHARLARLFEARGDGLRAAQHLLRAGQQQQGLDLLVQTSRESERRTDADIRAYFDAMRALPADWLALFKEGVDLCEALQRPLADQDALLSRAAGFITIAHNTPGVDGFALLARRLARLTREVGLDLYASLPADMDPGTRLGVALKQAKQRYGEAASDQRVFDPATAIRALTTTLLAALGIISYSCDVRAQRQMPSLGPLVALAPSLWLVQQTIEGVGRRIEGRFERASEIYHGILARMEQPDRAGLQATEHSATLLRISLSIGTLEACMGLSSADARAQLVASDPHYVTQGLMLRHLCELWQGKLAEADATGQQVEQRRAVSSTHNNYDGQYLLAQLCAQALLGDLKGLRQSAEAARRVAEVYPAWSPVAEYCMSEYEYCRGDLGSALASVELALGAIGGPLQHQIWPYAAGAHVRVLSDLGRAQEARDAGERYMSQALEAGLGFLVNYIRVPWSLALRSSDAARAMQLAEEAVSAFRALGSTGLNLTFALENCARIAAAAGDHRARDHYIALSEAEDPVLSRRLRRVHGGTGLLAGGAAALGSTGTMLSELASVLGSCNDVDECGLRALRLLQRHVGARGAVCYLWREGALKRIASTGELPHADGLERWAHAYFEGQRMAQHASTSQLDLHEDARLSDYGMPDGMYVPCVIGHRGADRYHYVGLVALMMPVSPDFGWLTEFVETFSRSLDGAAA